MKVKFKKLHPDAVIPSKANPGDAGFDLVSVSTKFDNKSQIRNFGTGLAVEIPEGYVGYIFPRSSIYKTYFRLANCVGVIDSGYRGEIGFNFDIKSNAHKAYKIGDRIGQLIIMPIPEVEFVEVDELSDSSRGIGGFGSSGV